MQPKPAMEDTAGLPPAHLWELSGPGRFSVPCAEDTPAEGPETTHLRLVPFSKGSGNPGRRHTKPWT